MGASAAVRATTLTSFVHNISTGGHAHLLSLSPLHQQTRGGGGSTAELEVRLKALLRMQQAVMRQFEEALETSDG